MRKNILRRPEIRRKKKFAIQPSDQPRQGERIAALKKLLTKIKNVLVGGKVKRSNRDAELRKNRRTRRTDGRTDGRMNTSGALEHHKV